MATELWPDEFKIEVIRQVVYELAAHGGDKGDRIIAEVQVLAQAAKDFRQLAIDRDPKDHVILDSEDASDLLGVLEGFPLFVGIRRRLREAIEAAQARGDENHGS